MKAPLRSTRTAWPFFLILLACSCGERARDRPSPEMSAGAGSSHEVQDPGAGGVASSSDASYAHVTAVNVSGEPSNYQFLVSIESSDVDCSQFADWWEVLSQDGSLLYRRILEHSHTDENGTSDPDAPGNTFTRDGGPVAVGPDSVVLVRAHLSNVGYRGRAMRGSPAGDFLPFELESSFAADVATVDPQPTGCLF